MFGKVFNLLIVVAINGFFALIVTALACIVIELLMAFAMIPVETIVNKETARAIMHWVNEPIFFKIVYTIIFFSMMADDLGWPNFKTWLKHWWQKKPAV